MKHDYLPEAFETFGSTKERRKKIRKAVLALDNKVKMEKKCSIDNRCHSGFCPTCLRLLRKKFLRFVQREELAKREWYMVTVFVEGWTKPAGDFEPFGELKNNPIIKKFLKQLRKVGQPDMLLFGSIETVFKVRDNKPIGKPFHLHMLISGASKEQIRVSVRKTIPRPTIGVPLRIDHVQQTAKDLVRSSSYILKQTFWLRSESKKGFKKLESPKPQQLAELLSNLGTHQWGDRFFYIGIRFCYGKFSITPNVKSMFTKKTNNKSHKSHTPLPKTPKK
ncbi:hypothetical protein DFR47_10216 [Pseudochrobactrum asaccharolyticum]|uniref:Replication protein n=1 Tax=Pseudochrobactrum asaccharolyticum TaxID=354351 RepID=A0A366E578_9HYPH|nr:hypothetical protein DFR47_10216 [Pseudochrobactrum asaccharolyticum]